MAVSAVEAYEIFADPVEIPRWLPMVHAARTLARFEDGRPERVAFIWTLQRGSLGYTLEYHYDPESLTVGWRTPDRSNVVLTGEAHFAPLSARACLMLYSLVIDLPIVDEPIGGEDMHPASRVVFEFREHVRRHC